MAICYIVFMAKKIQLASSHWESKFPIVSFVNVISLRSPYLITEGLS